LIIEKVIDGINDKNGKSAAKADKKMTKEEKRAAKAAAKKK
jgi:hypothetical protein